MFTNLHGKSLQHGLFLYSLNIVDGKTNLAINKKAFSVEGQFHMGLPNTSALFT